MKLWRDLRPVLTAVRRSGTAGALLGGALLAALTVLSGMALLGLSGWFITATAIAGLRRPRRFAFDVFMPSAGIRLLALGRTASRYGERLVTHDATLGVLARCASGCSAAGPSPRRRGSCWPGRRDCCFA